MLNYMPGTLIVTFIFIASVCFNTQAQGPAGYQDLHTILDSIRLKNNLPALAGAIVTSKGLIQADAAGYRKSGTEVPATVNDKWHLGSDTKAMTAMLIAILVEQGKLKWETKIEDVFPEISATLPAELRKVTFLHLLSHQAGIPANTNWFLLAQSGSVTEQRYKAVKLLSAIKAESEPGQKYLYSNWGYVIAGAMLEKLMSLQWEELINKYLFKLLDMKSIGFGGTGTPGQIDQPWGHTEGGKPVISNGPKMDNPAVMGPAGTVHCSISDWAKFIADQLRGARGNSALLKQEVYRKLHTPAFSGDYAIGWLAVKRNWGGGKVLTHAGSNTMNYAVVWMAPEYDFAVLVCTNQGGPDAQKGCDEAASAMINLKLKVW